MRDRPQRHTLCRDCYADLRPGQEPFLLRDPEIATCCRCQILFCRPVYYRAAATAFECGGAHR